ncbi:hypothetical protein LINGRAHAP2_LOCUS33530 [Linum grandiflorum]
MNAQCEDEHTLVVQVNAARGIDNEYASHPELGRNGRYYRVRLWVDQESVYDTNFVTAWTNPEWKQIIRIPVDMNSDRFTGYLSVEVERVGEPTEDMASTSEGSAVVGRAKVKLPAELGKRKGGSFELLCRNSNARSMMAHCEDEHTLLVQINAAHGIDEYSAHPELGCTNRVYRVRLWVDQEFVCYTSFVMALTNPEWKQMFRIPVDMNSDRFTGHLSLEVERIGEAIADVASTSTGSAVVGRAKVMLPAELGKMKGRNIVLVRAYGRECKAEGSLNLVMELKRSV